jgi:hypothetical protein
MTRQQQSPGTAQSNCAHLHHHEAEHLDTHVRIHLEHLQGQSQMPVSLMCILMAEGGLTGKSTA